MNKVNVYPNPFTRRISLEITSEENENTIVYMQDHNYKIIKMFSWYIKPGINKTSVDGLAHLPSGSYHLVIKDVTGNIISDVAVMKQETQA